MKLTQSAFPDIHLKGQKLNVLTVLRMEIRNKLLIAVRNLS